MTSCLILPILPLKLAYQEAVFASKLLRLLNENETSFAMFFNLSLYFSEIDNTLNQFLRRFISTTGTFILKFLTSAKNFRNRAYSGFDKFLFLFKVCALQFKKLLSCLSKRLISIAVYNRIAQRIKREH